MTASVRPATRGDLEELVDLMREFYAESDHPLDAAWAEEAFAQLLAEPRLGAVWLAEHEGEAAGHVVLTLRYTMEHGAPSGYVDDLFVRPRFRRRGIGRALLSELFAECARRGCKAAYVEVGDDNVAARRLYEQLGLGPFRDGRVLYGGPV